MVSTRTLDRVEYYPHTRGDEVRCKVNAAYLGVIERASDGMTVLSIRGPSSSRAHNIEVGQVYAITVAGQRHVLQTPSERWRIRAAEIGWVVTREREEWAAPYFDPRSPKYYRAAADYESPTDETAEARHFRATPGRPQAHVPEDQGCATVFAAIVVGWVVLKVFGFL
jgi:hypothetical protein